MLLSVIVVGHVLSISAGIFSGPAALCALSFSDNLYFVGGGITSLDSYGACLFQNGQLDYMYSYVEIFMSPYV